MIFLLVLLHNPSNLRPILALMNHAYTRGSYSMSAVVVLLDDGGLQSGIGGTQ